MMRVKKDMVEREEIGLSAPTDEDLMLRYRDGDAEAMNELVHRHDRQLFGFLWRSLSSREKAEDAYQEVFIKVVRSAPRYEPSARFAAWLYTIARNVVIDMARRDKLRVTESLDAEVFEDGGATRLDMVPSDEADPEAELGGMQLAELLEQAISDLPAEQREVFLLREKSGLSFKEIAKLTRAPLNTVKTRMHYALNRLRKTLAHQGYMEEKA
jgi:RNA polymerase sigma-70 factor, ECF subfamily